MKKILFIRHGKSSWDYMVDDRDRPLLPRGINDAHLVGDALKGLHKGVDQVFSSPANRASHTCMIVTRVLGIPLDLVKVVGALYDFSGHQVLDFIKGLDDAKSNIFVFGHNHALTSLVNTLGDTYIANVPTAGAVMVEFDTNKWEHISNGKTIHTVFPRNLKN